MDTGISPEDGTTIKIDLNHPRVKNILEEMLIAACRKADRETNPQEQPDKMLMLAILNNLQETGKADAPSIIKSLAERYGFPAETTSKLKTMFGIFCSRLFILLACNMAVSNHAETTC